MFSSSQGRIRLRSNRWSFQIVDASSQIRRAIWLRIRGQTAERNYNLADWTQWAFESGGFAERIQVKRQAVSWFLLLIFRNCQGAHDIKLIKIDHLALGRHLKCGRTCKLESAAFLIWLLIFLWRFWWWKIDALAKSGQWAELETLGKSKKSPVGYLVSKWFV